MEYQVKAVTEAEGCTCNKAVFKAITISQKAGDDACAEFVQTVTAVDDEKITYEATAGTEYVVKPLGTPVETYFANSNAEGCPITYSLVNHIGEPLGEQTMLILDGSVLKFDENQYVADSI